VLKILSLTFRNETLKTNNARAIKLHVALSLIGLFSFIILGESPQALIPLILPIVGGSLIYIVCGFMFFAHTKERAYLSVLWLSVITFTAGVISALGHIIMMFVDPVNSDIVGFVASVSVGAAVLVNTVGMGILALFYEFGFNTSGILGFFILILTPILPPLLLFLGLQLKVLFPDGDERN